MTQVLSLFWEILPLYLLIFFGYLAGKYYEVQSYHVARVLIYFVTPVVIFAGTAHASLSVSAVMLPVVYLVLMVLVCGLGLWAGKALKDDATRRLNAFAIASGNTGYFGIPVAISIYGQSALSITVMCVLGSVVYQYLFGYYILARGRHSVKDSIHMLLRVPVMYSFVAGLLVSAYRVDVSYLDGLFGWCQGAYTVLGMMIVGIGVAGVRRSDCDRLFVVGSLLGKHLIFPICGMTVVVLDKMFFHIYSTEILGILFLLSAVPVGANTVAFASDLRLKPEKASMVVIISTLFGLFIVPCSMAAFQWIVEKL